MIKIILRMLALMIVIVSFALADDSAIQSNDKDIFMLSHTMNSTTSALVNNTGLTNGAAHFSQSVRYTANSSDDRFARVKKGKFTFKKKLHQECE